MVLKRIAVSLIALGVLLVCYKAYFHVFGRFSLQPLPPIWTPPLVSTDVPWTNTTPTSNHAKDMARRVWGADAWQADDDVITLYWLQSGVIVYIKDYEKESADTWRLVPFALIYTESKANGGEPQIVTLEGHDATLIFDRPVDLIRMSGARPVGGMIRGNVQIQADRGTESPVDDLVAYVDQLHFKENERRVWTDSPVRLVSADAVITGIGGEMHLQFSESDNPGSDPPRFESVSDIVLFRDVQVNMLAANKAMTPIASKSLAGPKNKPDKAPKEEPKLPVAISCLGPFRYDLQSSKAHFQRNVTMVRQTNDLQYDRLFCDELVVSFEKATEDDRDPTEVRSQKPNNMQFEFRQAHATGRSVRVLSDSQSIEAIGQEMVYDAESGSTVLRGDPDVVAIKEGNVLNSRELRFTAASGRQLAEAVGEGSLETRDAEGEITLTARWSEWARLAPQGEQGKNQLLILQGNSEVDQPGRGSFKADRLKVWLQPAAGEANGGSSGQDDTSGRWAPSRVEGVGRVLAKSEQFLMEAASKLDMVFEDIASLPVAPSTSQSHRSKSGSGRSDRRTSGGSGTDHRGDAASAAQARTPKPPAHLIADTVKIKIVRAGNRSEVSEVETEGHVDFEQPAADGNGDSVIVHGDALSLKRVEQKYYLQVVGRPAHVELNSMKVDGERVNVDQPTSTAWVDGRGVMTLTSDTSFAGKKLDAPSELTIAWGTRMFFDGLVAEFGGGVEARQGASQMRCQSLIARLTEPIDLAAPRKQSGAAAKIKELECLQSVALENTEYLDGKLDKFEHLEATQLNFWSQSGQMTARGPGIFRTCTRGESSLGPPQPVLGTKTPAKPSNPDQLFLTEVRFADRLEGDQRQQIAKFFGHVEAVRSPVAHHTESINSDSLSPNSMRIACSTLEMATKRGPEDRSYSVMVASDNVNVEADVFTGRADRVSYNQLHDRLVFESRGDAPATFYRTPRRGVRPDETKAFKIYYNLRTYDVKVEGALMLDLQERETDRRNSDKSPTKKR